MQNIKAKPISGNFNVAVVTSRFNEEVTSMLYEGALQRLRELEFRDAQVHSVWVPGAVEIPLIAKKLAKTNHYEAIICLGAVIRGETTHYDYVCQQVSDGCQRVALDHELPIIFGVLTTENVAQAKDRLGGKKGHKGRDAVDAAYEMVSLSQQIS
ncbi:MAG: 6,7-dimethyl-8-ribityllumazine synthase [Gammaproteobacteria bacterium]